MKNQAAKNIIPLYDQVAKTIKNRIVSGQYEPGEKLSCEEDIAKELGVSRITIRQAFSQLEEDGYITRQRSRGTTVTESSPAFTKTEITSLRDMLQIISKSEIIPVSIAKIKVKHSGSAREIRRFFTLSNEDEIGRIQRLLIRGDATRHLIENFISADMVTHITKKEITRRKRILQILSEKIDLEFGSVTAHLEAMAADRDISNLLKWPVMAPFYRLNMHVHFASGDPLEIVNNYLSAESFKFGFNVSTDDLVF